MRNVLITITAIGVAMGQALALVATAAELKPLADGYPARPLVAIVPYGAGGGAEQVTRALGAAVKELGGPTFQVEIKPGGGGLAAMPDFMSRPKDGYTILEHDDALISAIAAGRSDLRPGVDIEPICITQSTFGQVYIRPDEKRFTDWASFVAYAKAHPGELTMSNSGSSTAMEAVQSAALERAAGIKLRQVGFDKPAERYGALLGGHVDSMFEQPGDVKQFLEANQMKPILTLLPKRPAEFANVPALADVALLNIPDFQRVRMFWVHKDVPEARKQYLRSACELAYKTDRYRKFNESMFMHIGRSYYNSADSLAYVNSMIENFKAAYKEMGIVK